MNRAAWRRRTIDLSIIGIPVVLAWLPVIVGLRSAFHWDLFYEHVPFRAYVAPLLARGELPLWAPGIRGGYPLYANGEAGMFSPVELPLLMLLAPHRAVDATLVVSSFLAAAFTAAFVRSLGASRAAAVFAGIAYGLSGRLVVAVWPNAAVVAALMPALFLGVERIRQQPTAPAPTIGLALAIGAALLAGRPQNLVVTAPFLIAYALAGLVGYLRGPEQRRMSGALRYGRSLAIAVALGLALGAPQMLSTLALARSSDRGEGLTLSERAWPPLTAHDLPSVFFAVGGSERWPEARAQVGVLTLLLVAMAIGYALTGRASGERARSRLLLGFVVGGAVAFTLALGTATPAFGWLSSLPILRGLRVPARFLVPYALALAVAGGLAFDLVFTARAWRLRWMVLAGLTIEMVVSAWCTIPWTSPAVYATLPHIVPALRQLPLDASGAPPRYIALEETYLPVGRLLDGDEAVLRQTVEHLDAANGDRALLYNLANVVGYGEPIALWQRDFLDTLTPARQRALGVATVISGSLSGQGDPVRRLTVTATDDALPRALLIPRAYHVYGPKEGREALDRAADPSAAVFIEDGDGSSIPESDFPTRPAHVVRATATTLDVDVDAPADGWLVVFDAWDSGWRATVAGAPAPIHRADGFFRAVAVPAGQSRVRFTYRPAELEVGVGCFAAAVLMMVGLWWVRRVSRG